MIVNLDKNAEPPVEFLESDAHQVIFRADRESGDVNLECTSRLALFEFGKALMLQALHGEGWAEFFPLGVDGKWLVVDGARLGEGSGRVFVSFPKEPE